MEPFIHNPHYRIIICQQCRFAVIPNQVESHLASIKHRVSPAKRRLIRDHIMAIPDLILTRAQLADELIVPIPGQAPIPGLPVFHNGLACEFAGCRFVCQAKTSMKEHCREKHQWANPYSRGGSIRQRRAHIYPWRENVHCQQLFTRGPRPEYFEVAIEIPNSQGEGNVPSEATVRPSISQKGQRELERIREQ